MKRKAKRISPAKLQLLKKAGKNFKDKIKGFGYQVPPDEDIVRIYFDQKSFRNMAEIFYRDCRAQHWKTKTGKKIYNWKVLAADWIFDYRQSVKLALRRSKFCNQS